MNAEVTAFINDNTEDSTMTSPATKTGGFVSSILGQIATKVFWKDLAKALINEMVTSLLIGFGQALGGTLVWYGRSKKQKEIDTGGFCGSPVGAQSNGSSDTASRAFGGSYAPHPAYSTPSSYPSSSSSDGRFPGFGR